MGRPKRKLSPLKSDNKVRKLSAFGFSRELSAECEKCENNEEINKESNKEINEDIVSLESSAQVPKSVRQNKSVVRNFRHEWQHNRDWLVYDPITKAMFCKICQETKMDNSFVSGCTSLKIDNVKAHENPTGKQKGKLFCIEDCRFVMLQLG